MTPDDVQKLKEDIQAVIVSFCKEKGINTSNPIHMSDNSRLIWSALQESGKLHPQMTYQGFMEGIRHGVLLAASDIDFVNFVFRARV